MNHLTAEEIILGHDLAIERYGGLSGPTDPARVETLIELVRNYEYYNAQSSVFVLAALYCVSIAKGHVFLDGNKRTSINAAYLFLMRNEVEVHELADLEDVVIKVATDAISIEELAAYFESAFGH